VRDTVAGHRPESVDGLRPPGRIAVVVVNYGSPDLLRRNLPGLGPVPVVVVDNHKTDGDSAAARALAGEHGWQLLALDRNVGFGAAMNVGVRAALDSGAEVVLLLNPDAEIGPDALEGLRRAALADPAAMITPRIVHPDGSTWFSGGMLSLAEGRLRLRDGTPPPRYERWLTGACLALHRDLWERLGGFDEDYFLYWEDVDLSRRCERAGGRLVVRADLVASHQVGGTQADEPQRAKSAVYYRYNCRNRLLFAAKHLPPRDQLRWLLLAPADTWRVVLRGGRRQLLRPGRTVRPAVLGMLAGAGWLLRAAARRALGSVRRRTG
jgi:N-acetylglucosaminyl-diphospho-decaprenol L-rhamnosyltransferase